VSKKKPKKPVDEALAEVVEIDAARAVAGPDSVLEKIEEAQAALNDLSEMFVNAATPARALAVYSTMAKYHAHGGKILRVRRLCWHNEDDGESYVLKCKPGALVSVIGIQPQWLERDVYMAMWEVQLVKPHPHVYPSRGLYIHGLCSDEDALDDWCVDEKATKEYELTHYSYINLGGSPAVDKEIRELENAAKAIKWPDVGELRPDARKVPGKWIYSVDELAR
jgi:hypothetical protein